MSVTGVAEALCEDGHGLRAACSWVIFTHAVEAVTQVWQARGRAKGTHIAFIAGNPLSYNVNVAQNSTASIWQDPICRENRYRYIQQHNSR